MRKLTVFFILIAALAGASPASAQLLFHADFAPDGAYDTTWPLKVGDVVAVDIYVSNVPEPGLINMGFTLNYDSIKLELVKAATTVDSGNWPIPYLKMDVLGEIEMAGARIGEGLEGLAGNHILLGTVTFLCIAEGTSELMLLDREDDWFVLDEEPPVVLDGDIGAGVLLTTIVEFFDLTVAKSGVGKGTVTSVPAGINCGTDCTEPFGSGTAVQLTATVQSGSTFAGWTGCDSASQNDCTVQMGANRTVSARFEEEFPWLLFMPAFMKRGAR